MRKSSLLVAFLHGCLFRQSALLFPVARESVFFCGVYTVCPELSEALAVHSEVEDTCHMRRVRRVWRVQRVPRVE